MRVVVFQDLFLIVSNVAEDEYFHLVTLFGADLVRIPHRSRRPRL